MDDELKIMADLQGPNVLSDLHYKKLSWPYFKSKNWGFKKENSAADDRNVILYIDCLNTGQRPAVFCWWFWVDDHYKCKRINFVLHINILCNFRRKIKCILSEQKMSRPPRSERRPAALSPPPPPPITPEWEETIREEITKGLHSLREQVRENQNIQPCSWGKAKPNLSSSFC